MRVRGHDYRAVWMEGSKVVVVDQPLLPHRFRLRRLENHRETAAAIRTMIVRGAGTIGATAAYGLAQACLEARPSARGGRGAAAARRFTDRVAGAYATLLATRPTAADLKHALDRVAARVKAELGAPPAADPTAVGRACEAALDEARGIADEYAERGRRIGEQGLPLIEDGTRVLTHCNAGWLALVDWGSAPAPVYLAHRKGRDVFVWVDETRPRNQGANLTSWELLQEGVPHKVIADNAGGWFMRRGEVDLVIVGADRIAANGDVANKIGTYEKAVLAREHGIPFYVAAPTSTIDPLCPSGDEIPIEERAEDELHYVQGSGRGGLGRVRVTPRAASAANPAFDVTPARYVTGIITERGIVPPGQVADLVGRRR
ncbi:MAG TPA: S-methyl-5-thioribose-1-phosphate isomerase [Gemmatimonadota bacterium]|jgi:S-methyl-5-thioribose-1-phosphate isomerase